MSSESSARVARWAASLGLTREQLEVTGVVSFYMVAALIMVFVNKAVLNSTPSLPLLFLLIQLLMAVFLLHIFAFFFPRHITLPKFELQTLKKLVPVVSISLCGLVFNTLCLRAVEAAFFQIARGLLLPFTIVISSLATRSLPTPTAPVFIAALIVTFGFLIGVAPSAPHVVDIVGGVGETGGITAPSVPSQSAVATPLALTYGILSALFIALHSVLVKSSLPHVGGSALSLAYWTNLGSALVLGPVVLVGGEGVEFLRLVASARATAEAEASVGAVVLGEWEWTTFVWGSLVTGVFGALLCVAGMLSVKATSPITHMFSSAGKSVLQTVLGVWLFQDLMTTGRASSIGVILLGTLYYTWVKSQPNSQQPAASSIPMQQQQKDEEQALMKEREREESMFVVDDKDLED